MLNISILIALLNLHKDTLSLINNGRKYRYLIELLTFFYVLLWLDTWKKGFTPSVMFMYFIIFYKAALDMLWLQTFIFLAHHYTCVQSIISLSLRGLNFLNMILVWSRYGTFPITRITLFWSIINSCRRLSYVLPRISQQ